MSNITPNPLSPNTTVSQTGSGSPSAASGSVGMTYDQVENTWIQAGGNPQAAAMAAAIADASSGLNPDSTFTNPDGTVSIGLWLIPQNGTPPGSTDPISNARAAIQLSGNGSDWSQWCSAWSDNNCGLSGGTYLGEGANALASLGQKLTPSSYNVIGSAPSGTGTGASTATTSSTSSTTGSKSKTILVILLLIGIIIVVMWLARNKQDEGEGESQTRSRSSWSPEEEAGLASDLSDEQLSAETGRSVRAIRVRRSQKKYR